MLEGIDRVVDLVGFRSSGLTGATADEILGSLREADATRLSLTDGHFAAVAREGQTVRLARTIGFPLRYFVAKMYHGPFLIVSDRIDRMFEWCQEQRIGWQFDPSYTRMVPAHYIVELDQVGCPDPAPRYKRFFTPPIGEGTSDTEAAGAAYIGAAYEAVKRWVARVPEDEPIAVAFSGGIDSTAILLLARKACEDLGRPAGRVRAFTLDFGDGPDAAQAAAVVRDLAVEENWERVTAHPDEYDLEQAIRLIEDYHPLDVECAASALCLLAGIRRRHPTLRYLLDGDGGDENLKSYPLEDSDLTLSSVLRNPLLYQEGWGIDAIKHSLAYSGGLSRGYVRTYAPAAAFGFQAFSPFTVRSVMAKALAIPFEHAIEGREDRLASLKQEVVRAGVRSILGVDMPAHPKRRFQDGAAGSPRARVTKTWCRQVFDHLWRERMRDADEQSARFEVQSAK